MKKKFFGILAFIMLSAGVILPSADVFAITETSAKSACETLGGTGSKYRQDGMWYYKCTGYTTSGYSADANKKIEACKLFNGTYASPASDVWSCQNLKDIVVTEGSGYGSNPTYGNNGGSNPTYGNNGGSNPTYGNNGGSNPTYGGGGSSGGGSSGGGSSDPTYDPGSYTGASTSAKCGGVKTSIINCDDKEDGSALFAVLALILNIVTYGVGAAAVVGVIITGFQYMSARDNPAQVAKAKNRLLQVVIGLVIWLLFWGVLQFLLPGGLFGDGS